MIHQIVAELADHLAAQNGNDYVITTSEWRELIAQKGINPESAYPTDYCYNRVNDGIINDGIIDPERPAVFEYIGRGRFYCRGRGYSYSGLIFQRPKGAKKDEVVGCCKNGIRTLYK